MITRLIGAAALAAAGYYLLNKQKQGAFGNAGSSVRETIEVDVPIRTAYDQWTQFEEFPTFMESVQEIKQLDDKRLHWKATVFGKQIEWDAEITEQIPDKRIAWRSTTGTPNSGVVSFKSLGDNRTRIVLEMSYTPTDPIEQVGDALGAVRSEAQANLKKFKQIIEARGTETGAWRGTIEGARVTH
jgi:uncharacterized membrane protein